MIKEEDISVDVWQNGEEMITIHCDNCKIIKQEILDNQTNIEMVNDMMAELNIEPPLELWLSNSLSWKEKAGEYDKIKQEILDNQEEIIKLKEEIRQLKYRINDEQDSHHTDCRKEINRLKSRLARHLEINEELRNIITKRNLELRHCKCKINMLGGKNVK